MPHHEHRPTVVVGRVLVVNQYGFRLHSAPRWFRVARDAPRGTIPPVGARVRVTADPAGWVQQVEPAGDVERDPSDNDFPA